MKYKHRLAALLSSLMVLSTCTIGFLPVQAEHTLEPTLTDELLGRTARNFVVGNDDVIYSSEKNGEFPFDPYVPNPGTFDRSPLLLVLLQDYPTEHYGVQFVGYGEDGFAGEEEVERLRQLGIEAFLMEDGSHRIFAILDAEQLENFPADESIGYLIGLAANPNPEPAPKHTFEAEYSDEYLDELLDTSYYADKYFLGEDGVFYSTPELWDFIHDDYVPNGGTFDRTALLLALLHRYPEGRFAVQFEGWAGYGYEEEFSPEKELERLRQNGINASMINEGAVTTGMLYAVLDAEQLENFPVDETVGYLMGLAAKPTETPDPEQPSELQPLSAERLEEILNKYIIDGVLYSYPELWEFVYEGQITGEGTFSRSDFMQALLKFFPDGCFPVRFTARDIERDIVQKTIARLQQIGLEASPTEEDDTILVTIQDEEQLTIFVEDETMRKLMGVTPAPSVTVVAGDINQDDEIGMLDVVYLQKYLLKTAEFTTDQWANADINQDGEVDVFDLALLKKMIVEK